ncbi:P-loop containing nucleoside triphosphate hydrolase protein [Schizopora paradoxa]|uniref:p-loop containing nucleoside triphosphate hydrolase protein n=1 Tax=Schizopora paradoxa TaxID=27342 RepID=A0A0H2RQ68_9AGAM|nr:P-loop containing nucleoside triphosphate hydrolase protein [Schizopora paradoxa]
MDLDDELERISAQTEGKLDAVPEVEVAQGLSALKALSVVDHSWYAPFSKKSRWMDLVGDYAGQELFVIDGDSLIQYILDDPLLALGKSDTSFQSLHALHSLEKLLAGLRTRHANFEVVFWHDHRHSALRTGSSSSLVASRGLARRILFNHLLKLDVKVHVFSSLSDEGWKAFQSRQRPMFILMNDGGSYNEDVAEDAAQRLLLQRLIVRDILCSRLAVVLLAPLEFRDAKIFTFVVEELRQSGKDFNFPAGVSHAQELARRELENWEANVVLYPQALQISEKTNGDDTIEPALVVASRAFASHSEVQRDPTLLFILKAFIAHLLSLRSLPLQLRAQSHPSVGEALEATIVNVFYPIMFICLDKAISTSSIPLDVDGHVFMAILDLQLRSPGEPFTRFVGAGVSSEVENILRLAGIPTAIDLPNVVPPPSAQFANGHAIQRPSSATVSVLPFSNLAFEGLLPSVHEEEDDGDVAASQSHFKYQRRFEDTRHWHGKRTILPAHQGGEAARKATEWARMKELKRHQRNMNNMQKLAESLTGALGTQLQKKRILASARNAEAPSSGKSREKPQQQAKGKKPPPMKKADKIKAQNTTAKASKEDDELAKKWSADVKRLEHPDRSLQLHLNMKEIDAIIASNQMRDTWYDSEVRLYQIHTELRLWAASGDKEETRDSFSVSILRKVLELFQHKKLTKTIIDCLGTVLAAMGFSSYFPQLASQAEGRLIDDRRLEFKFVKLQRKSGEQLYKFMQISDDPVEWQLRLFGEFMDRSMDGKADSRVSFKPDGWQREVLDSLDADKSILVVAPTSAGKTFISFYAMEKVLRDSDDGILVYIAPTKALVNQVAAEVYARFEKEVPGQSMWSIHTRDYRLNDPQKCQILVTVPEMFAIMLLSPPLAKLWTPRIKRIILDEIHSIGQQEGGAVWEQILLLAPCPIVGLSATIGSPEVFNNWLASVQKAHNFKHTFVFHPYRYSHLRKHIYQLPKKFQPFEGLSSLQEENIRFLHPVSALAFGTNTIPPDFSLEARDTLTLYNALKPFDAHIEGGLSRFDPKAYFQRGALLKQKDVIDYELKLKDILLQLMSSPDDANRSILGKVIKSLQDSEVAKIDGSALNMAPSPKPFLEGLIHLLTEMHVKGALPAILFSFDRSNIEIMAMQVLEDLTRAEEVEKNSPKWRAKVKQWEAWKVAQEKKQKAQAKVAKKRADAEEMRESQETSLSWESSFDPSDPLPEFSFADLKRYSRGELLKDIEELKWSRASIPSWALDALHRGVAVHHSGMNKGYRNLVERLFRLGFLRVMFATGTLALGINAPAKSSVFCGDSPFLTALNYRQCAGRAGRRGFDLLGNVIFYGIPMDRIQRLILSRLPLLTGNFPLTSTLSLRLFNLLHGSENSESAVKAVRSLMKLPQISFGSSSGQQQLAHHMRFSIEYLRRAGLLDSHGKPMDLYGIAAHLYHAEPSNLALVCLMHRGVLHRIAGQASFENAKRELMLVLCHLFGRHYLPQAYGTQENVARLRIEKKYSSLIVLPPLPDFAREVLEEHNAEILGIFSSYASSYVSVAETSLGTDYKLSFSDREFKPSEDDDKSLQGTLLEEHLKCTALKVTTRSLFVANSGLGDRVQSVEELARTCRRGLELNEHAIPSLTQISSLPSNDRPNLNAYLLDFFTHGQLDMIVTANGIRRGDVWYLLQDFDLTLKAIRLALDQLLLEASGKKIADGADGELATLENDWEDDFEDDRTASSVKVAETVEEDQEEPDVVSNDWDEDEDAPKKRKQSPTSSKQQAQQGVTEADRRVVKLVNDVCEEFGEKFRKIFA